MDLLGRLLCCNLLVPGLLAAAVPLSGEAATSALEEVVVTARKREEGLQEVPMAVTAIGELTVEDLRLNSVDDLYGYVPGLYFTTVGGAGPTADFTYLQIRGVGFNGGLEPAVGVFVDGMYMPQIGYDLSFLDVERIEVLRGPQGTLFGRNTQAGALNIVTQQPTENMEGKAEFEVAEFGTARARASFGGALSDTFFANVNAQYYKTDGFVDNLTTGQEVGSSEQVTGRVNFRWEPSEDFSATLIADASSKDFIDAGTSVLLDGSENYHAYADQDTEDTNETGGIQLNIDWDLNDQLVFNSLTGYRTAESDVSFDPDSNVSDQTVLTLSPVTMTTTVPSMPISVAPEAIDVFGVFHRTRLEQDFFSQEFRLSSGIDAIDWLVGAYYFDQSMTQSRQFDIGPGIPFVPLYIREAFTEDRDGYAAFGQLSYRPFERWEFTAGARYSDEQVKKDGERVLNILDASIFAFRVPGEASDDNVSLMGSASYAASDNANVYFTVSEGWKAGGINRFPSRGNAVLPYDSEESTNYELGLKSQWADGRIIANIAAYFIEIQGQQVLTVVPDPGGATPVTIIDNAADSESYGAEVEFSALLTEGLKFDLAYSLNKTEFKDYFLNNGAGVPTVDKSGDPFDFVPETIASAALTYTVPQLVGDLDLDTALNWRYIDGYTLPDGSYSAPLGSQLSVPSYDRLDFRIGLRNADWRVSVYVDNVLDSFDYTNITRDPFLPLDEAPFYVTPLSPRQVGIVLTRYLD
jgi:iron complex outermembrane receptor protein